MEVSFKDIQEARNHLRSIVYKTSLVHNTTFSEMTGNLIYLRPKISKRPGLLKLEAHLIRLPACLISKRNAAS